MDGRSHNYCNWKLIPVFKKGDKVQFISEGLLVAGVVKECRDSSPDMWYLIDEGCKDSWIFEGHLIPLTPLPVIPKFVADVIRILKGKWGDDLATSIDYKLYTEQFVHEWSFDERIRGWLQYASNQETFARAWMGEYEVEKEPLYYIKVVDSYYGFINLDLATGEYSTSTAEEVVVLKTKFTESEIKNMDARYWDFAVPVEEVEAENNE
ncbi:DUF1642 domain-containing protein [Listeria seeligeri]|uniref:DUF1642 domain-containing protein n=1 Tax=Listeria seeligeri TaxID=1640 RepID=UPI0022EB2B89|nr:DUF1642 domain-containing protein [Listeria seeligeri]